MQGSKTVVGHLQTGKGRLGMTGYLRPLAGDTRSAEILDLRGHLPPNETSGDVAERGIAARVCQAVDASQESRHQRRRDDGSRRCSRARDVHEKAATLRQRLPNEPERGRGIVQIGLHLVRGDQLSGGELGWADDGRRGHGRDGGWQLRWRRTWRTAQGISDHIGSCLLYTSPSPRDS